MRQLDGYAFGKSKNLEEKWETTMHLLAVINMVSLFGLVCRYTTGTITYGYVCVCGL